MKNFRQWLRNIGHWLRRMPITRHYWWAGAVVLCAVAAVWGFAWSEKSIRIAGASLQLGGVLTVVWGILKTREDFNQEPIRRMFYRWFKSFPRYRMRHVLGGASITIPAMTGEGYATSTHGPAEDQSVEGRLSHLEGIVRKLETAQGKTHAAVIQAEKNAQRALKEQGRQLVNQIGDVAKKIEETAIGGIHVSAVGVILLFAGTVLGGFGPELHCLFGT